MGKHGKGSFSGTDQPATNKDKGPSSAISGGTTVDSDLSKTRKIENVMFSVMFTVLGDSSTGASNNAHEKHRSRVRADTFNVLLICYDAVQWACLCIGDGWSSEVLSILYSGVSLFEASESGTHTDPPFFWVSVGFAIVIISLLAWITYTVLTDRSQLRHPKLLNFLRFLFRSVMLGLFVPFTRSLVSPLIPSLNYVDPISVLPTFFYMVFGGVFLALWLPIAMAFATLYVRFDPSSKSLFAAPHGRHRAVYYFLSFVLVVSKAIVPGLTPFLGIIFAAIELCIIVQTMPYYSRSANALMGALSAFCCTFALGCAVLAFLNSDSDSIIARALSPGIIVLSILVTPLVGIWIGRRYNRFTRPSFNVEGSVMGGSIYNTAEAVGAPLPQDEFGGVTTKSLLLDLPVVADIADFIREAQTELKHRHILQVFRPTEGDIAQIDESFRRLRQKYPYSGFLRCCEVIYSSALKNALASQVVIRQAGSIPLAFDFRFCLFVYSKEVDRLTQLRNLGEEVFEFRQSYEKTQALHAMAVRQIRNFWKVLAKTRTVSPEILAELPKLVERFDLVKNNAAKAYANMVIKFPRSKFLLRSYGSFLSEVANEPQKAEQQYFRADELEEIETRKQAENQSEVLSQSDALTKSAGAQSESSAGTSQSGGGAGKKFKTKGGARVVIKELKAISTLRWIIVIGVVVLMLIGIADFLVVQSVFNTRSARLQQIRACIVQRVHLMGMLLNIRAMNLWAFEGNQAKYNASRTALASKLNAFLLNLNNLYFGWADGSITPIKTVTFLDAWQNRNLGIDWYIKGKPDTVLSEDMSLFDASRAICGKLRMLVSADMASIGGSNATANAAFRFLFDNGPFEMTTAWHEMAQRYQDAVFDDSTNSDIILSCLMGFGVFVILAIWFFGFQPSLKKVQATQRGIQDIVLQIPHEVVRDIFKHYLKSKDQKSHSASGSESSNSDVEPDAASGEESGPSKRDEHEDQSDRRSRQLALFRQAGKKKLGSLRRDRPRGHSGEPLGAIFSDDEGDHHPAQSEPEPEPPHRLHHVEDHESDGSVLSPKEAGRGPRGGAPLDGVTPDGNVAAGSDSDSGHDRGPKISRTESWVLAKLTAEAHPDRLDGHPGLVGEATAEARSHHSRKSRKSRRKASLGGVKNEADGGSRAHHRHQPDQSESQDKVGVGVGVGGGPEPSGLRARKKAAKKANREDEGRDSHKGPKEEAMLRSERSGERSHDRKKRGEVEHPTNKVLPMWEELSKSDKGRSDREDHSDGADLDGGLMSPSDKEDAHRSGRLSLRDSRVNNGSRQPLKPSLSFKAKHEQGFGLGTINSSDENAARAVLSGSNGSFGHQHSGSFGPRDSGSFGPRNSGSFDHRKQGTMASLFGFFKRKDERDGQEGSGQAYLVSDDPNKEKRKMSNVRFHGHGPEGIPNISSPASSLFTKLKTQYTLSNTLLVLILLGNLALCVYQIETEKYKGSEIQNGGIRRWYMRAIAFAARELYVNDNNYGTRTQIVARLQGYITSVVNIHHAIKFGDMSLGLPGSIGRYGPQDDLLFKDNCFLTNTSACLPNRVRSMQAVSNGLDWAIAYLVESAQSVLQDFSAFTDPSSPAIASSVTQYTYSAILKGSTPLADLMELGVDGEIDAGLFKAVTIFTDEAFVRINTMMNAEAGILGAWLFLLTCVWLFVFRPMTNQLQLEGNRTGQFLSMIPLQHIRKLNFLHHHLSWSNGKDDK